MGVHKLDGNDGNNRAEALTPGACLPSQPSFFMDKGLGKNYPPNAILSISEHSLPGERPISDPSSSLLYSA